MAIYKFYNIQLLPINTKEIPEVGEEGYCKLFEFLSAQIQEYKNNSYKISSIAVAMRGDMLFAPFSVSTFDIPAGKGASKLIYGSFLKFDDINELFDTNSGETEYVTKGNTSSKRFDFGFVFDPHHHVMAIHDAKGLPTRGPLINALRDILEVHTQKHFKDYSLEIEELTSAESIKIFFDRKMSGFKKYDGYVTFSNSDKFNDYVDSIMVKEAEKELKDKSVGKWSVRYDSFKSSSMSELPEQAKIQMALAAQYGNVEISYLDEEGVKKKYVMEDYPVRESLNEKRTMGMRDKAIEIKNLIFKAIQKTIFKK